MYGADAVMLDDLEDNFFEEFTGPPTREEFAMDEAFCSCCHDEVES
jgi:hypothetical protein